ncbi:unannotated protein [freshwater metagenome]|uniref:Unannotated protein n=1 Tax=freshwater metagenome TaxID=449393 RepID=A0A6J6JW14_9ZZZZ
MRCMTGTRCQQHHPWCVGRASSVVCNIGNGVINEIFGEVIASPVGARCGDMCVVAHNFGAVLISFSIEESVEAIEPARKWPSIKRTSGACLSERCDMPFANHVVAVAVRTKHFGKGACFVCDLAAIAGVAAVEVGEATNTNRVMITTSEQCGSRCGTHRCRVKARESKTTLCDCINGGCVVLGAIATKICKAHIVKQHDENVGLSCSLIVVREIWGRLRDRLADGAGKSSGCGWGKRHLSLRECLLSVLSSPYCRDNQVRSDVL